MVALVPPLLASRRMNNQGADGRPPWLHGVASFLTPAMAADAQAAGTGLQHPQHLPPPTSVFVAAQRSDRHRLEAIMNMDEGANLQAPAPAAAGFSKSSLAFILGVMADESDASVAALGELATGQSALPVGSVAASVAAAAAVAVAPAAPRVVKKSRICKFENCTRYVVNRGLCIGHGGGKRCAVAGCTSSAKNLGVCWKHGGSTKCTVAGCENRAKSRGVCWSHGGGRKCNEGACTKTAVSHGLCWAHGGGKRCVVEGCRKPAYERNGNLCSLHQAGGATATQPTTRR